MTEIRGFTLIEVLVSLIATAIIAIAASSLLTSVLDQRDSQRDVDHQIARLQMARSVIKSDFAQIVARPVKDAYGMRRPFAFEGGEAKGSLVSMVRGGWHNPGEAQPRSSLQFVEYVVVDSNLVRRSRPRLDATPDTPVSETVLFERIERASISFHDGRQWLDRWRVPAGFDGTLPKAIAIEIVTPEFGTMRQLFRTPRS